MDITIQLLDFKTLQELVEREQNIKIEKLKLDGNNITIKADINLYKEDSNSENFLRIVFRCNHDEMVISWLYLLEESKGTGTKIVQWFMDYCKANNYKTLKIVNVKEDRIKMISICEKFGFIKKEMSDETYSDYYLEIRGCEDGQDN